MKSLIVVRHGHYKADDHLSKRGTEQIRALHARLKERIGNASVCILSSTKDRASESAQILADLFGVSFTEHEVLWSEASHPMDSDAAIALIQEHADQADFLILVTHFEYTRWFPEDYGEDVLGANFRGQEIEKGDACHIDCEAKTCTRV